MHKSRQQVDDLRFKIDQVFEAYGKTVSKTLFDTWLQTLSKFSAEEISEGLTAHLRGDNGNDSKYAPRPKHIADLIDRDRQKNKSMHRVSDEPQEKTADPKIAKAWVVFMLKAHGWAPPDVNKSVSMTFDEALEIVNREASRLGHPESIPDEFKLPQFWGQQDELVGF